LLCAWAANEFGAPVVGVLSTHWDIVLAGLIGAAVASMGLGPFWRRLANLPLPGSGKALREPWVVDGDTIDDRSTGVRYRFANIDAPETGENAKCINERRQGDIAKAVVIGIVRRAKTVSVRATWRKDRHGRRVAYVYADGADIGETLVSRGLAAPWRGRREKWCGVNGGLSRMAVVRGQRFECRYCRNWR
jgi:endonuclease YncB( thermonuclease family)